MKIDRFRNLFAALAILVLVSGSQPAQAQNEPPETGVAQALPRVDLHMGKATLSTQIAATSGQREIGLMYVSKMPDNDGMIFLMPNTAPVAFWMKNTLIPLSIAYIDKNGIILEIHDMKALDLSIIRSDSDQVTYALETNLHWFALNGIKAGDKLDPAPGTLGGPKP